MEWQDWFELGEETDWPSGVYGIYRVRVTNPQGAPIPIPRIGGVDPDGILNIGRSGFTTSKTDRSLGRRLWEFWRVAHSGACWDARTLTDSRRAVMSTRSKARPSVRKSQPSSRLIVESARPENSAARSRT